jgi:ATP-dependent Lon protease
METEVIKLRQTVLQAKLPEELQNKLMSSLERLSFALRAGSSSSFGFYEQTVAYINWLTHLPWNSSSQDILNIDRAKLTFNKNHYGLNEIKQRILEYLSVIILQRKKSGVPLSEGNYTSLKSNKKTESSVKLELRAPILCFVGLVGTGKTTMAVSVAEALNRQLIRIPFGGLASALDLRGLSRVHSEAEPGIVIKALRRVNVNNPVILLDELDRVSDDKRQEIMGVLVELLDPEQNKAFTDHYIDFPFDLSKAIFVATANNVNKVATAVIDRMEVIQMPSYSDEEKVHIGKEYLLPSAIKEAGLSSDNIKVDEDVWPILIRPLGYDSGIRTLKRIVQGVVRRVAWKTLNHEGTSFKVTKQNYREFMV